MGNLFCCWRKPYCHKCGHYHDYQCSTVLTNYGCNCGHLHKPSLSRHENRCGKILKTENKPTKYFEKETIKEPIYELVNKIVPITTYTYETVENEEDVTKYREETKTRTVTKYKDERRTRTHTTYETKGKYVTENVSVQVIEPRYYRDGSSRFSTRLEPRQKYVTWTEPVKKEEVYYDKVPYTDTETYTDKIPYTVREKVTRQIKIPHVHEETRQVKEIVRYEHVVKDVEKTWYVMVSTYCQCMTCTCFKCTGQTRVCGCIRYSSFVH